MHRSGSWFFIFFFSTDIVLSDHNYSLWVSSLLTGRTDPWSLWTVIAHWSDLALQDKNKMAAWCHGERGTMGRPIPERPVGEWAENRAAMETIAVPRCVCPRPLLRDDPSRSSEAGFILTQNLHLFHSDSQSNCQIGHYHTLWFQL